MKRSIFFIFIVFSVEIIAQEVSDSIRKTIFLDEVVVTASNITRMDDHLLIYPNKQQKGHSNNGYGVLKNLMIPGLSVNTQSHNVEMMGMQASLYINGQECDSKEIQMIRPRDIEKIEFYDAPSGKYAKDKIAINFVLKQYEYGGYLQLDGLQTVGYTHGDYNVAGGFSKGNTTFNLYMGANYEDVENSNETIGVEHYDLLENDVCRELDSYTDSKKHSEYVQLRVQNKKGGRYLVGKFSLVNNSIPKVFTEGLLSKNGTSTLFRSFLEQGSIFPKLDLNAEFPISKTKKITLGAHGRYSNNTYDRYYEEGLFQTQVKESEEAGDFQLSAIYSDYGEKSSFSGELYHYHNIWNAEYEASDLLRQNLWQSESLAFLSYNYRFSKQFAIQSRLGLDWLQYKLCNHEKFSQLTPRLNLNVQYNLSTGMLLWSFNYMNSYYGMNTINDAAVTINPYLIEKGNPNMNKSHDINSYVYYSGKFKKFALTAMGQYRFSHNPVINDYYTDDSKIVKTYSNDADIHYYSIIIAATYSLNESMAFSGDLRYNHTFIDSRQNKHNNDLTGNLRLKLYWGRFSLAPYLNFNQKVLDMSTLTTQKIPLNYGMSCSYTNKDFYAELYLESPFTKRKEHHILNTPSYSFDSYEWNRKTYQYCHVKVSYSFDFGRKTNRIKRNVDTQTNSSLLGVTQ